MAGSSRTAAIFASSRRRRYAVGMSLSPQEKQALRQRQGLLAGTRQWSMPRLSSPIRRRRKGGLFATGLVVGLVLAGGALAAAVALDLI